MNSERTQALYGLWKVDSHPAVIEYSSLVMSEIADFVNDGLQQLVRGGIEVGGILFGSRDGSALRIKAWRPLMCEHAHGPSFLLSAKDQQGLEKLVSDSKSDPELKECEPLGWFHSHTRSEIYLTSDDLQIYHRYFPEPWQVALVLRPKRDERVRAGFFIRESGQPVRAESSLLEFAIEPVSKAVIQPPSITPAPIAPSLPEAPPVRSERVVHSPLWLKWLSLAAVILLLLAAVRITAFKWRTESENPVILPLSVTDLSGTLQIEWDRGFKQVVEADSAEILIADGAQKFTKVLDAAAVREGAFHFVRNNEDVRIQLTLFRRGKPTAKEISVFVGPKFVRGSEEVPGRTNRKRQRVADENVRLREALTKETARAQRLEETVRTLQERLAAPNQ